MKNKKGLACILLFAVLVLCLGWPAAAAAPGNYTAPITTLTTKAPIPAIKKAFAKAVGDTVQIEDMQFDFID